METASTNQNIFQKTAKAICKTIGHNWRYKDYSGWMNENGDEYEFIASRNCIRCNQHQYFYKEWEIKREKSPYDVERDSMSVKQLPSLQNHLNQTYK